MLYIEFVIGDKKTTIAIAQCASAYWNDSHLIWKNVRRYIILYVICTDHTLVHVLPLYTRHTTHRRPILRYTHM